MSFAPEDKPRLQDQKQWKEFPRDPVELLLLAHVNGANTVRELSVFCARTVEQTAQILERLVRAGIIVPPGGAPAASTPASARAAGDAPGSDEFLVDPRFLKKLGEIDTAVLAEAVDLEPRRKEEILLLYHSLSTLTPFQLFAIRGDATDKDVKRAYQRLSLRFHPDRYYGKNLGSFKPMMERIFRVVSETFALLSSEENRKKLASVYPEDFAPRMPAPEAEPAREREPASKTLPESRPPAAASRPAGSAGPSAAPPVPREGVGRHRVGLRNQIARILARSESSSMVSGDDSSEDDEASPVIPPPPGGYRTPPVRPPATDALHRMAQEKLQRIQTHLAEGKRALSTQSYGTAASHFKLVLSLDPDHEEASRLYREAEAKNRDFLGNSYAARARMEDEMGDHQKSADLWELAVENLPTLENVMSAAAAFLKIGNHLKARQYAQQAVQLSDKPEPAILLAQVYLAAGMALRAQSTLQALLEKHPRHPVATRLLREAEKLAKSK